MGKTKWFEGGHELPPQPKKTNGQRTLTKPMAYRPSAAEPVRQKRVYRWRRQFGALWFRLHSLTFGLFKRHTLLKLATIAVLAYAVATGRWPLAGAEDKTITTDAVVQETSLDVLSDTPTPVKARKKNPAKPTQPAKKSAKTNPNAPVGVKDLPSGNAEDYIRRYQHIARVEMQKYGVPASISLAQGLIESRAGSSTLARKNNNHFGIKCFQRLCPPGHCTNHNDDHHKDFFRNFKNPWESWRAHSRMLSSGRYAKLKKNGADYRKWAYGLASVGYATDPQYAEKLITIIERHNLQQYDR